jgi:hypothetical protein
LIPFNGTWNRKRRYCRHPLLSWQALDLTAIKHKKSIKAEEVKDMAVAKDRPFFF